MEDIRPYRIRNEENDRRSRDADNRTEWELTQRRNQPRMRSSFTSRATDVSVM